MVPALRMSTATPAVYLPGTVVDALFTGVWEGTASKRTDLSTYDEAQRVPVRIALPKLTAMEKISVWGVAPETLADGSRFAAIGTIENLNQNVKASDGTYMASLASMGAANPFFGATTADVRLLRYPSMHAYGADQIVLDFPGGTEHGVNGMSDKVTFTTPGGMARPAPPKDWTHQDVHPHGAPNGMLIDITRVVGGGGGC